MRVKRALGIVLAAVGGVLLLSVVVSTQQTAPGYVQVYVNESTGTFDTPPCVRGAEIAPGTYRPPAGFRVARDSDAIRAGLRPDPVCVNSGGFVAPPVSALRALLGLVGVPAPQPPWRADGTWR